MGNKSTFQIMRIGNVYVKIKTSCILTLKNVMHVPNIQLNLLFASTLDNKGYEQSMGKGTWKLNK